MARRTKTLREWFFVQDDLNSSKQTITFGKIENVKAVLAFSLI